MPLVPEDGTGLANANSLISLEEANQYFAVHPYYADNWYDLGSPEKESLLVQASMALCSLIIWRGTIYSVTQSLCWPRTGVYDNEGRLLASNTVPERVKWATAETAFSLFKTNPFVPGDAQAQGLEELKIDVIELKFASSTPVAPLPTPALMHLMGLGEYALGSRVRRVVPG